MPNGDGEFWIYDCQYFVVQAAVVHSEEYLAESNSVKPLAVLPLFPKLVAIGTADHVCTSRSVERADPKRRQWIRHGANQLLRFRCFCFSSVLHDFVRRSRLLSNKYFCRDEHWKRFNRAFLLARCVAVQFDFLHQHDDVGCELNCVRWVQQRVHCLLAQFSRCTSNDDVINIHRERLQARQRELIRRIVFVCFTCRRQDFSYKLLHLIVQYVDSRYNRERIRELFSRRLVVFRRHRRSIFVIILLKNQRL